MSMAVLLPPSQDKQQRNEMNDPSHDHQDQKCGGGMIHSRSMLRLQKNTTSGESHMCETLKEQIE